MKPFLFFKPRAAGVSLHIEEMARQAEMEGHMVIRWPAITPDEPNAIKYPGGCLANTQWIGFRTDWLRADEIDS